MAPKNPSIKPLKETATEYRAIDSNNPKWFIEAVLDSDGYLTFEVVREDATEESSIRGHEFFNAVMNHFGEVVRVVVGHWVDTPGFDSNLKLFNEKTKHGASKKDAAFSTKTGTWARQWGFATIQLLDTTPEDFPGGYEQVLVEFRKS